MGTQLRRPASARHATLLGDASTALSEARVRGFVQEQLAALPLDGRSVCLLVPDATRSGPVALLLSAAYEALAGRASRLAAVVALGTHPPMSEPDLARHCGCLPGQTLAARYPEMSVMNHQWWQPDALITVGHISARRLAELSGGLLHTGVDVRINRAVIEHDVTVVVGPVFPHEVVGFSGGAKYLFPGVSGQELIDVSHWLGALITSAEIIGRPGITPVRALIDEAAAFVPTEKLAICAVVRPEAGGLHALSIGQMGDAWVQAARVSAQAHIHYLDRPVPRVLSLIPERYTDMWTAAKGFYKVEPVVADAGQVVLYAPHVREFSVTHPSVAQVGYHCRDYFVKQWARFEGLGWGVLAHSTHLRGSGRFDAATGIETDRVTVTLATGIPERQVRAVGLDYLDPNDVQVAAWQADPQALVVRDAGERLFRLR